HRPLEHVTKRKERDHHIRIGREGPSAVHDSSRIRDDVAVCEHHSLQCSRCSGRVTNSRQRIRRRFHVRRTM
ncbi:hypothetical protein PMAYCL1PPCAC_16560, partial [Pristionchus mayeri]